MNHSSFISPFFVQLTRYCRWQWYLLANIIKLTPTPVNHWVPMQKTCHDIPFAFTVYPFILCQRIGVYLFIEHNIRTHTRGFIYFKNQIIQLGSTKRHDCQLYPITSWLIICWVLRIHSSHPHVHMHAFHFQVQFT